MSPTEDSAEAALAGEAAAAIDAKAVSETKVRFDFIIFITPVHLGGLKQQRRTLWLGQLSPFCPIRDIIDLK